MLLPPAREPGAVRALPLRRRHVLAPVGAVVLLLVLAVFGAAGLGMRYYEGQLAPDVAYMHERLRLSEQRLLAVNDTVGTLRAQIAALAGALDQRVATPRPGTTALASVRAPARPAGILLPLDGRITSRFSPSRLHPVLRIRRPHRGLDIAAPSGTTIRSPAGGRITRVARELGYGLVVHVDHGGGVTTRYAHCRSALVRVGDVVALGTPIATVGRTGLATAPHLHYEVRVRGQAVDPLRVPVVAAER
jgi:murein DD-endopeptidase MepM/ murein hydrolase activator NlpD